MIASLSERISSILKGCELPSLSAVLEESREIASGITIGRTSFMEKFDVSSEYEYKLRCIKEKKIMYHAHIGMNTWEETVTALGGIYRFAEENNFTIDRAGICIDRRMSLPPALRKSAPQESGPYLESEEDWRQVGRAAPIQPHMGDFIIGFPASTVNAVAALKAGVTTVGNLSQFFAHEAPMWKRLDITTVETVKAIGIMGALRDRGTLMHSYLDDGFGALFLDCSTAAAWAYLEKYIVEELLGARIAHCVGGLVSDPVKRAGWIFALDEIHNHECVGSMFFGDTISSDRDPKKNVALTAEYLLWDVMAQLECPTGHGLMPVPFTEASRAPSLEEICEVQLWAREMEKIARRMYPYFDFSESRKFASSICARGRKIFADALAFFADCGVDTKDAVQLLYVLKAIGPRAFEDQLNPSASAGGSAKKELIPNDIFTRTLDQAELWRPRYESEEARAALGGLRVLLASTDVHEHGLLLINKLLEAAGASVCNIGAERNPDEVVSEAAAKDSEIIFISTHNGMALEYARNLIDEMEEQDYKRPLCMGGVLNQNTDEGTTPVDVSGDLEAMGIAVVTELELLPSRAAALMKRAAAKEGAEEKVD
ncbi:MAG: cobalamin-dependent protein [Synergistaceae bacterium]|nr:cobalamin-dependent protein [Synergistaceae bacterium]